MKKIILYGTSGCHLCEQARALIEPLLGDAGYALEEADISESEPLLARYQFTIPVAKNPETGEELGWPFDAAQFGQLLG